MKNLILIFAFLLISSAVFSQRVDIDNKRFAVEYAGLPTHYVPADQRTYVVELVGNSGINPEEVYSMMNVRGWQQVDENANAKIVINASDLRVNEPKQNKRKEESKNKEGKVISTKYYYSYTLSAGAPSSLRVFGPENKMKLSKWEIKQKAKEDAKKAEKIEEVESNPFLSGTDAGDEIVSEDDAKSIGWSDVTPSYEYTTSEHSSSFKAQNALSTMIGPKTNEFRGNMASTLAAQTNSYLNSFYGYTRVSDFAKFKKLDSKKHPENEMYNNATDAMEKILKTKRFNQSTDKVIADLTPIIDYLEGVKKKYSSDDKHDQKLKAATMWNLGQLYYYLDMPDKCKAIGEEYVRWGEDVKDGEEFIERAESLSEALAFHNMKGRYFDTDENAEDVFLDSKGDDFD